MKKLLSLLLGVSMMLSLAACGGTPASTSTATGDTGDTADAATAETTGEDPYADLGDFTMVVGHAQPEGNPRYTSLEKFAEDVSAATNGHVTVHREGNAGTGRGRHHSGHARRPV